MTFHELEFPVPFKANVYVDWLNIKKHGGAELDFDKLFRLIHNRSGCVLRAIIYLPAAESEGEERLHDAMVRSGFQLFRMEGEKVNCDSQMTVDMVTQCGGVDVVYLVANDSDYLPAVRYLQSLGKRVLLIHADKPSNELRRVADEWRKLEQLDLLRKEPKQRATNRKR